MRCIYWSDLKRLILDNKRWPPTVRFYPPTSTVPNKMTVVDFNYLHRNPRDLAKTGYDAQDWFRDSAVGLVTIWNGMCPLDSGFDAHGQPYGGAVNLINNLLSNNVILDTEEVRTWKRLHRIGPAYQ